MNNKLIDTKVNSQEELESFCKENNLTLYVNYKDDILETRKQYKEIDYLFKFKPHLLCTSVMINCFLNDINSLDYKENKINIFDIVYLYDTGEDYNSEILSDDALVYYSKYVEWLQNKFMKHLEEDK